MASALAARRGQATIVGLVTLLACAALAIAPAYTALAVAEVEAAAVEGAPVQHRLISISKRQGRGEVGAPDPVPEVRRAFSPPGFIAVTGGHANGDLDPAVWGGEFDAVVAHRAQMCDALVVTGDCPAAAGEILLPAAQAARAGLAAGDHVDISQRGEDLPRLRVVGVYQVEDTGDPYWADGALVGVGPDADPTALTLFTAAETLAEYERVTYTYDLVATPEAFAGADAATVWAGLTPRLAELSKQGFTVTTDLETLVERIGREQRNMTTGMTVGVAILLLFTWFTLVVALRGAAAQIRGDVGWWRLHGVPSGRCWLGALSQGAAPLLVGGLIGAAAGLLVSTRLSLAPEAWDGALVVALSLVGLALGGGLAVVVASQIGTLRSPVRDLIRQAPARRARWRRSVVDLVVVVLAVVAVGQALTVGRDAEGMALLAPALATLAIAFTAAWLSHPLVAALGSRALRSGRLTVALVSASLARRGGVHSTFAVATVAVGLVTVGLVGWDTQERTQWARAAFESGAHRVVAVAPVDPDQLLAAVRAVDPAGTEAMAVIRRPAIGGEPPVLAVDSDRLGVMVDWRDEYGGELTKITAALRPVEPEPVTLSSEQVSLLAAGADWSGEDVYVRLLFSVLDTGEQTSTVLGPLEAEAAEHVGDVPDCAAGCRLVGLQVLGPPDGATDHRPPTDGTWVEMQGLTAGDGTEVGAGVLTDPTRWRPAVDRNVKGPALTASDNALQVTVAMVTDESHIRDDWAYVVDTPVPVPVVSAGWVRDPIEELLLSVFSWQAVPVEEVATTSLLPMSRGDGVLVDVEYVDRLRPAFAPPVGAEVWLSASAPASIVDELRAAGLHPLREETFADHLSQLQAGGSAVAVRFQAAVSVIGLLLAAGVVLVAAAQQRSGHAAELAALRVQGVSARVVRAVGYSEALAVVAAATVVGVVAGVAGAAVARVLHPGFVDGWRLLPPSNPGPIPVVAAGALAFVVLGVAGVAAAVSLLRSTRRVAS